MFQLAGYIVGLVAHRDRQPGDAGGESRIRAIVPLHGSSLTVTALVFGPAPLALGILHILLELGIVVLHPDLFAVIQNGSPTQCEIQTRHDLGDVIVVFAVTVAVVGALNIVIADHEYRPALGGIYRRNLLAKVWRAIAC